MIAASPGITTAALIAGLVVAAFIVAAGVQVFRSAAEADGHVKASSALARIAPQTDAERDARPNAPRAMPVGAPGAPRADETRDPGAQIFTLLSTYYAANLSQATTIFWASLLAMSIGFAIVFVGVLSAGSNGITAVAAAIAGVLGQFIAATFLLVLRSTQEQGTSYVQTLVELRLRDLARSADARSVDLGLRLLDEISADRTNPANATKATIATGLIVKIAPTVVEPAPAVAEPVPVTVTAPQEPLSERRTRSGIVTFDETAPAEPVR